VTAGPGSRRRFLAGVATAGAAALGGCSALPFGEEGERRELPASLPADVVGPVEWPASPFPATVPASLADAHEARTPEVLAAVPSDPDVPNTAVAEKIRSDREQARKRADTAAPDGWPTDVLSAWRQRRADAAAVRGAYRAATGTDDGAEARPPEPTTGRRWPPADARSGTIAGRSRPIWSTAPGRRRRRRWRTNRSSRCSRGARNTSSPA